MKNLTANNVERTLDTTSKAAGLMEHPSDSQYAITCILADIAISLSVLADTLILMAASKEGKE